MKFEIKNYLAKLQSLPEQRKKIILWTVVVILGLTMGFFWVRGAMDSLSGVGKEMQNVKLPEIDTSQIPAMPSLDILQTTTPSNIK
ncbi:MAG: hypothetical protein NT155_03880 [Candidatus Staskawiczbacteria bacterium]|nr:hypothetical protein [Candidatus Staskawiczbacteria bacterium]